MKTLTVNWGDLFNITKMTSTADDTRVLDENLPPQPASPVEKTDIYLGRNSLGAIPLVIIAIGHDEFGFNK